MSGSSVENVGTGAVDQKLVEAYRRFGVEVFGLGEHCDATRKHEFEPECPICDAMEHLRKVIEAGT